MKTVMITGANSGVGFETARQLGLDRTVEKIFLVCRTQKKGNDARERLVKLCGGSADRFEVLVMDVSSIRSTRESIIALNQAQPGLKFDFVILNAGCVGKPVLERTSDGVEISYAASLVGHHVMTVSMLHRSMFNPDATILISGAEAARGDLPGMVLYDVHQLAEQSHNGDLVQTMTELAQGSLPNEYLPRNNLATLKAFTQWWGAAMARKLEEHDVPVKLFVVSPGGTPGTNGANNLPFAMRTFIKLATPLFIATGQAHTIKKAASRYLEFTNWPASDSGKFFASPAGKNTGDLVDNIPLYAHFQDRALQNAALATLEGITGEVV